MSRMSVFNSPFLLGFEQFERTIDRISKLSTETYPPDNIEQIWGYKENDQMGGKDIYSGSKGGAELVIKSYYNSFFKSTDSEEKPCKPATKALSVP